MSKRLLVLLAVKAMLEQALPNAAVLGLDPNDVKPAKIPADGLIWIDFGDPGPPEVDLSPPIYHYEHDIPVDLAFYLPAGSTAVDTLDDKLDPIDAAITADRTLGGLCDYLEPSAPTGGEVDKTGAMPVAWASFTLTASYSTTSPLG